MTSVLPTTFAVVHLCSEEGRQGSGAQGTARQGTRGLIPARAIYCRRPSTSSPRSRWDKRLRVLKPFLVFSSITILPLPLHSHLTTIQSNARDNSLALQVPAVRQRQQHSIGAEVCRTATMDCVRRDRVDLDRSLAKSDMTVLQLLLTSMVGSETLFLRYVVQKVHRLYRMTCPLY